MKKYVFRKYDVKFKAQFRIEKKKLQKIIGQDAIIEHIGSTAVPGLGGKGIIDILISVPKKELNKNLKILEKNGFEYEKIGLDNERKLLRKYKKGSRVHIHLTYLNSNIRRSFIVVRDTLRRSKLLREKYTKIKKEAIKNMKKGQKYGDYKSEFLRSIAHKEVNKK